MKSEISVVIPVFNEQDNIATIYKRLVDSLTVITNQYQFIFVNDGSSDSSFVEILKLAENDNKVYYINFSRNFGHQIAVSAGLEMSSGNCVVIIDADLQDPPELIPKLYDTYKKGYDVVHAKRSFREGESFFKKVTAKLFYRTLNKISSFEIPLDVGDFRLIDRKVVDALNKMSEQSKFLRGQIAWLGFKQTYVSYNRDRRLHGKSGYSYSKMFRLAFDGITGFSDKPLTLVTKLGFAISLVSFLVILFAIFSHFVLKQTITGWTSLIVSSMFIGGIQLFSIGIIGEYLSRVNRNVKNRPLYVIRDTNIEQQKIESANDNT